MAATRLDAVVSLAKRRGFVYPCGEIYGGTKSAWDYGPLGVELKDNIKRQWWNAMVRSREDIVGLDSSVILPRQVWVASGHVAAFVDPLVECTVLPQALPRRPSRRGVRRRRRAGSPENGLADIPCPNCGTRGAWTEPKEFNGLLKTYLGPVEDESGLHYLRPETAQGIFINYNNVASSSRKKPPFGIGQIGKSFRNEITPGNFIFRTREFEQMEMEFFVKPGTDEEWHQYWIDTRTDWYVDLGLSRDNLRQFEHPEGEAVALLEADGRHRVPLPLRQRMGRARGHRQPDRFRPQDPFGAFRRRAVVFRPGDRRTVDAVRRRAGGRVSTGR